jgi:hypothetical protein
MSSSALLPAVAAMQPWMHIGWASVLLFVFARLSRGIDSGARLVLGVLVVLWCLLPGVWGATHWLGLAFQLPSVLLVALCFRGVLDEVNSPGAGHDQTYWPGLLALLALGWLLLLDTAALLPFSLYAWGFTPAAAGLTTLLALLPWLVGHGKLAGLPSVSLLGMVIAVTALLKLPTGNVWDAWLDPWLWIALHVIAFRALRARLTPRTAS